MACAKEKGVTVALVERVWHGHVPTFYRTFCQLSMELGHDVLAICPAAEEMEAMARNPLPDPGPVTGKLEAIQFVPPQIDIRPRRFRGWMDCFLAMRHLKKVLREWEAKHGRKVDVVFFTCIYDGHFIYFPKPARGFPWAWSGLYVSCISFRRPASTVPGTNIMPRPERFLRHPKLRSIAIMDEAAVEWMRGLNGGRRVGVMPDFADRTAPESGGLGEALRRFAAGRPVVGLLGYLRPTKGIMTLARVALEPAYSDIVFAFAGELFGKFEPEDAERLERLKAAPNVFVHFETLPNEACFNGVADACDVLFAAYHDFPNSSNVLTKAAVFRKPAIVSDGYLMAERTRKYRLGEVIPQKDAASCGAAIRKILTDKEAWVRENRPMWEEFAAAHSREAAKRALAELIAP